jgi:hypothetical protein
LSQFAAESQETNRIDGGLTGSAHESVVRWGRVYPGNYIIFDVGERIVVWAGNALQEFYIPGLEAIISGNEGSG